MVGWLHWVNGHEFEQSLRVGEREAGHAAIHGVTEADTSQRLNNKSIDRLLSCTCTPGSLAVGKATLWGYAGSLWRHPHSEQQRNRPASSHASELGNNSSSPSQAWVLAAPGHSLTVDSYERPQARPAESLLGSWPSESVWEDVCCFKVLRLEVICHIGLETNIQYSSCPPASLAAPWNAISQAPQSMGFSRPESWNGLPCPPPGDLPDPGIEPASPMLAGRFFTTSTITATNIT